MNILYEMCTGFGKSKLALDSIPKTEPGQWNLIVVPKLVLIDNWKKEIEKWGYDVNNFDFVTYNSIEKKVLTFYKSIIWDECHHITDRVKKYLEVMHTENNIFLSATIKQELRLYLQMKFNVKVVKKNLSDAIDEGRLPEPEIILIQLHLDNTIKKYPLEKKYKGKPPYIKKCTEREIIDDMENLINWYKNKVMATNNEIMKHHWLRECLRRNKQLSIFKEQYTKKILYTLRDKRTLTFCAGINQTRQLGKYYVNSKNKDSLRYVQEFNDGKINHLTACNILAEGVNLVNCEYGIFNFLNSSEIIVNQKNGRLLRHEHPKIIIPYFVNTREDELVKKITDCFDSTNIKVYQEGMIKYLC